MLLVEIFLKSAKKFAFTKIAKTLRVLLKTRK